MDKTNIEENKDTVNEIKNSEIASDVKKKAVKKNMVLKITLRVLAFLGTTLLLLIAGIYGMCFILIHGPSETAKNQFVCSVKESSAMGFVAHIYLSGTEIDKIMSNRGIIEVGVGTVSDPNLILIPEPENTGGSGDNDNTDSNDEPDEKDIEIVDIKGTTYRGKLMIVKDPSRVFVGIVPKFYEGHGEVVADTAKRYDAIGGINGGEFLDKGSYSYSALPVGGVISQGNHVFGDPDTKYNLSGFTKDNKFFIGKMSVREALAMGARDAVHTHWTTGPFLVLNGETLTVPDPSVYGGGKNPRTAIGQRSDGAVLLLVVDGRQANSIGATFEELAYIMLENGAVNASAMDGGTSTQMYYDGEVINSPYSPTGPRRCPTSFLVSR